MLIGEDVGLTERKNKIDLEDGDHFRATVLDDDGLLAGVMLADLQAIVRLSCKLKMLPESEMDTQIGIGEDSEDSIETMSEIFNTMSAAINNAKTTPTFGPHH